VDDSNLQGRGDARLAELKAQRLSRDDIWAELVKSGFTADEATDLVDGVPLSVRPPPPPLLAEVIQCAAREILQGRENAGESRPAGTTPADPASMEFWEALLGGRRDANWILGAPEIEAAVADRDGVRLHRLMEGQRTYAPNENARAMLDGVLASRRLFASPNFKDPPRIRALGIRFALQPGGPRTERHGTSIGTSILKFSILPLAPIGQYVIAQTPTREWKVLGRVPLSRFCVWWRRVAVFAGAVLVCWIAIR
jgi:hypothetical protein